MTQVKIITMQCPGAYGSPNIAPVARQEVRRYWRDRLSKATWSATRTHFKIERQSRDFDFKVAHHYALIVVEHLNILGLVKNRHLS